ncbi:hypothetical protein RGQ15_11650 [Paracoccus sp. MBLB3053]|uniref:Microcystin-dependent protein n=1 Tax=Paracoccus aurantius TaxID=3073814 RepID=A0ABU2HT46_9RHOB|nr:hypothetical protein [Paracoccus sp. MBLB3053]MDS9468221.1 hypothetical protein [Paracoccus sp. MBLB3053]
MQIIIPGVSAPQSGAGRNFRYLPGTEVPALDPLFFYDFSDGIVGQAYSGAFTNLAGGVNGSIIGTRAAPLRTTAGMQVESVNGLLINTGISTQRSSYVLAALLRMLPKASGSPATYNLGLLTATDSNTIQADPTANTSMTGFPGIGFSLNDNNQSLMGFSNGLAPAGSSSTNSQIPTGLAVQNTWFPVALNIDGPTGRAKIHTLQGVEDRSDGITGDTWIRDFFVTNLAARSGNLVVGINPNGNPRAVAGPLGTLVCAGAFDGNRSDDEVTAILTGMAKIAANRNLAVAGYAA